MEVGTPEITSQNWNQRNKAAFIKNFLLQRNFTVQHGNASSDIHKQDREVPQDSILSVSLFILKINCITVFINTGIEKFLYVADFAIVYSSPNIPTVEKQLENCLNKIEKWTKENSFQFSIKNNAYTSAKMHISLQARNKYKRT